MMKKLLSVLLVLVMVLSFAACTSTKDVAATDTSESAAGSSDTTAAQETAAKTVVNIGLNGTVTDVSPFAPTDTNEYPIEFTMYERLFTTPSISSQETVSVIGKSWEWVDEYTAEITIFDYVHDVDGNPITAQDVVFSYETCKAAATQTDTANIDTITATGDYTLQIKLLDANAQGTMVKLLTHINIVNQAAYEANSETTPGTSGYKLTSYTNGSEFVFEKTNDYWQTPELTAYSSEANVDKIVFQCIPEKTQMTMALENDEIQMAIKADGLEAARFDEGGEDAEGFLVDTHTGSFSLDLIFNCTDSSLCSDVNLRKAILYAIDRDQVVKIVLNNAGVAASDMVSDQLAGFNQDWLTADYFKHDATKAAEYLAQSNYNGEVLKFEAQAGYESELELMQGQLAAVGINVEIKTFENALWQGQKVAGTGESDWDIELDGIGGSLVTTAWKVKFNPANFSTNLPQCGTTDPEIVSLLTKAAETQDAADLNAFHDYLADQAYAIGLYVPADKCITVDTITDICYNNMGFVVPGASNYDAYSITE